MMGDELKQKLIDLRLKQQLIDLRDAVMALGEHIRDKDAGVLGLGIYDNNNSREALDRMFKLAHKTMSESEGVEEMCPNCITPWKCNGPHLTPNTNSDDS